ncbi:hypothetical protein L1987_18584 [Smallanthus sonchifolius]|uniref:Uncharacterized protein n=1 Tax=Smallanthus sonchifolius TaxID=185202 RepID=A0ACB9IZZ6_9ASTR|nr:hypothetical protein L1987_18584 [Smallanthus sonchifolius]
MENESERVVVSCPNLKVNRSEMEVIKDMPVEMVACNINKEQSSIPGSVASSECSSASVRILGAADKKGAFFDSVVNSDEESNLAGKSWSAGILDSTGKPGFTDAGVLKDEGSFPMTTPLFSTSFKAKVMESMGRVSAGKPGFAENMVIAGLVSSSHAQPPHTRVVDFSVAADSTVDKDGPRDGEAGSRASGLLVGLGLRPALDGSHEPDGVPYVADDHVEPMHEIGVNPEPGDAANCESMQYGYMSEPIPLNEGGLLRNPGSGSKPEGDPSSSRKNPFLGTRQNSIMDDGFFKVTKKKKKKNGPKPRVQIPSLNALDDATQIDDGFPELNATLKKFAMRYVNENTIPDLDVFKTWSQDLKEYYYSLTKDDGEEVESETDGTAKLMSTGVS